jgi:putative intracellular protease/amidase
MINLKEGEKMAKKAVILTGKLVQDDEYIYPYYRLQEAGFEVDVAVRGKETVQGSIGVKSCRIKIYAN